VLPEGQYQDLGYLMKNAAHYPFAIDPHAFRDDDGQWYIFYARDFLDSSNGFHPGTGVVMDKLVEMTRLAGKERVVLRARSDWQLFKADRLMYGRVWNWHTLEGPCVRKHEGRYYCFYSGGCYENRSYGVDYGIAEQVLGPYSDLGNENGPRFMKSIPDSIIGPGHHSIFVGQDDQSEFVAYHAWDRAMSMRQFHLGKLDWTQKGPRCIPASTAMARQRS
jgi:GH43 family beta-xylosidase